MPSLPLDIKGYVRARHVLVPEFSVQANVSKPLWADKAEGYIDRTPLSHYNQPDFEQTTRLGYGSFFRNENAFHAQKKYKDTTYDWIRNHGDRFLYYTTTFDTSANPLTKEDPDITLPAEDRQIGGLGIYLTKQTMDDVRYVYCGGRNIFTIVKKLR